MKDWVFKKIWKIEYIFNVAGDAVSGREIERAVYSGILEPSADWHSLTHEGSAVNRDLRLTYRVRVQCEPNYYNATCTKFCRPRNDMFGHYECDRNGDKTCMPGWTGATCETGRFIYLFYFISCYLLCPYRCIKSLTTNQLQSERTRVKNQTKELK